MKTISIAFGQSKGTISKEIFGHFSEHIGGVFYDGLWVGEDSDIENVHGFRKALVDKFRAINPPVLRWPGGCFAETYDWRDGIGKRSERPVRINWWYNNDHRTESNQVGTHEFMDLCEMTGAQPYFAANMTSTTPLHIRNWMEYCLAPEGSTTLAKERAENGHPAPFDIRYWGIGNENWGGGGNMDAVTCAREYLRYATICDSVPGEKRFVACGANGHDISWTRELMQHLRLKNVMPYGMSVHYYCGTAGTPQEFTEDEWYRLLFQADYMKNIVDDHRAAMDEFDPARKVKLFVDEWGCWHKDGTGPSKGYNLFEQQSNMRDAVVSAMTLNTFVNRCDVVHMANVAQLCNNLHTLFLAGGKGFTVTPTYHVFDMFKTHQGAKQLTVINDCGAREFTEKSSRIYHPLDNVSAAASETEDGTVTVTLANTSITESAEVKLCGIGKVLSGKAEITILSSDDPHTCNTFEAPEAVCPVTETRTFTDGDTVTLPAASVASVILRRN